MKRIISVFLMLGLIFSLCSCGRYVSSYSAIGLVKSQKLHSCEASFYSLKGRLVFNIKAPSYDMPCRLEYIAEADKGELAVYYDRDGTKELLTKVRAGERTNDSSISIVGVKTVYIIVEAAEKAGGKISVKLTDHPNDFL
jgi:hypothetical protein